MPRPPGFRPSPTPAAAFSIEVGCALTSQACTAGDDVASSLAVVNVNANMNTANAYQSIEAASNK